MQTCLILTGLFVGSLAGNAFMNLWVRTNCFRKTTEPSETGCRSSLEWKSIIFEKKGHAFVDVVVGLFDQHDDLRYDH